jgi:tetratricopeptide (TPR) repeat protein
MANTRETPTNSQATHGRSVAPMAPHTMRGELPSDCFAEASELASDVFATARVAPTVVAVDAPTGPSLPGYAIEAELGRGGMGAVYRAHDQRLGRPVALKVILGGEFVSEIQRLRFTIEAENLARVRHPNVVQVHDVGVTPGGQPYLAMEYVGGGTLAERIKERALAPREGATLLANLADAVAAAHAVGVIHRDLKPANVLLEAAEPASLMPKLTDFGLAKRLEGAPEPTKSGAIAGTPAFMAPEQAMGETKHVGPLADVYGLGAVLYAVLAGRPPFTGENALEVLLRVREAEPEPMPGSVPSDLAVIARKAMAKEPTQRYPSAAALAADLRSWLAGRPIVARPAGSWERVQKWCRRNPAWAALVATAVGTVVALSGLTLWALRERSRAEIGERAASAARDQAFDALLAMTDDQALASLRQQQSLTAAQRQFLQRAAQAMQALSRTTASSYAERLRVAKAQHQAGRLQWRLGELTGAETAYRAALGQFEALAHERPEDADPQSGRAVCLNAMGVLHSERGDLDEAMNYFLDAIAAHDALAAAHPQVEHAANAAQSRVNVAHQLFTAGRHGHAEKLHREALDHFKKVAAETAHDPTNATAKAAWVLRHLGTLYTVTGRSAQGEACLVEAATIYQQLVARTPTEPAFRRDLARTLQDLGNNALEQGSIDQAHTAFRNAMEVQRQLVAEVPAVVEFREGLAKAYNGLATQMFNAGKRSAAEPEYQAARRILEQLVREYPEVPAYRADLVRALSNLGNLQRLEGRAADAVATLELGRTAVVAVARDLQTRILQAQLENVFGLAQKDAGNTRAAEAAFRAAVDLQAKLVAEAPRHADLRGDHYRALNNLADLLRQSGRLDEVERLYLSALEHRQWVVENGMNAGEASGLAHNQNYFGIFLRERGRAAEALSWHERAVAQIAKVLEAEPKSAWFRRTARDVHAGHATALAELGRHQDAAEAWRRAAAANDEVSRSSHYRVRQMDALARAGDLGPALAWAEELSLAPRANAATIYDCACVYALASVTQPKASHGTRAITLLKTAFAQGYRDLGHVLRDSDLHALRGRADFRALCWEAAEHVGRSQPQGP